MQAFDQIVTLDFETYFDAKYSLKAKALNTTDYIFSPLFKTQCVGVKFDDLPVKWYPGSEAKAVLSTIDWDRTALVAHNTMFDGLILTHHYGHTPAYYYDTLSMARALHSNEIRAGLNDVAAFYQKGNKLPDVLERTKGILDLPTPLMEQLGEYCAEDVRLCYEIFLEMFAELKAKELNLIDITIRMFCEPKLLIDVSRVQDELDREIREKAETIAASGVDKKVLSSAAKFAAELLTHGVEAPKKISKTTGKSTYAFSKTDTDFTELQAHPNEKVRHLVRARLVAKSTIGETRAKRFLDIGYRALPVCLNYYGAHTGRWSAGNKMNMQNLKRDGELRKSLLAPPGHVVVVADSAQIEARVLGWLAGDAELLSMFANHLDVYKVMAAKIYNIDVEAVSKVQRFVGKVATLGLGYGMGGKKFQHTLAVGAMGPPMFLTARQCDDAVVAYRLARMHIPRLWAQCNEMLDKMITNEEYKIGPVSTDGGTKIFLPNGLCLKYPFLQWVREEDGSSNLKYFTLMDGLKQRMNGGIIAPKTGKKIYGGLLTENIVQALARIIVADQMLRIHKAIKPLGGQVVTMTHDEIVTVVPEAEGQATLDLMIAEMRTPPSWCADIPLNAEGGFDRNYSK